MNSQQIATFIQANKGTNIQIQHNNNTVAKNCEITADIYKGLTVHDTFPNEKIDGMFFEHASQTIMFGMKFPIDVIFLSDSLKATIVKPDLQPANHGDELTDHNSITATPDSKYVLELPTGSIKKFNILLGNQFQLIPLQN